MYTLKHLKKTSLMAGDIMRLRGGGWMDGWVGGWVDGWMDGWMDG